MDAARTGPRARLALLIGIAFLLAPWARAEDAPPDASQSRYFHSQEGWKRVARWPRQAVESLFYPLKRFTIYAERVDLINRVKDFFYNKDYTAAWFPAFNFGGELNGPGVGINAFHNNLFGKGKKAQIGFIYAGTEALSAKATYEDPAIAGSPYYGTVKTDYIRDEDVELFARPQPGGALDLGVSTRPEDKASFELNRFQGRAEVGRQIGRTRAGLYAKGMRGRTEEGSGGGTPLTTRLSGFDQTLEMGGGGAHWVWDGRDNPIRPAHGARLAASGGVMASPATSSTGGGYGFTEYHVDLQQHLTLFEPHRTLALRAGLDRLTPTRGNAIPFYELPTLDLNHGLRSYERGRFRDQGALTFNAEYRYPVWVTWDAYLFFDGGQTFPDYNQVRAGNFRYSEGIGIRFASADKVLFNLQLGVGKEAPQIQIGLSQVF